jgi:hypothetical protein
MTTNDDCGDDDQPGVPTRSDDREDDDNECNEGDDYGCIMV